jgi:hypothetical protein
MVETPLTATPGKSRGPMRFAIRVGNAQCTNRMHCAVASNETLVAPAGAIPAVATAVRENLAAKAARCSRMRGVSGVGLRPIRH